MDSIVEIKYKLFKFFYKRDLDENDSVAIYFLNTSDGLFDYAYFQRNIFISSNNSVFINRFSDNPYNSIKNRFKISIPFDNYQLFDSYSLNPYILLYRKLLQPVSKSDINYYIQKENNIKEFRFSEPSTETEIKDLIIDLSVQLPDYVAKVIQRPIYGDWKYTDEITNEKDDEITEENIDGKKKKSKKNKSQTKKLKTSKKKSKTKKMKKSKKKRKN